ncbi:hypothetical protein NM208_g15512 [Fusarium decemcellulare]|uniref:Uncharacterized protein n=1 Tax=Fusarium decemcellulare TaxID=57161 RepID=A0ACC1RCT8_9HYPO|nr:hypothetical protein NM208_g15512 [Fusarium decemcellulare]
MPSIHLAPYAGAADSFDAFNTHAIPGSWTIIATRARSGLTPIYTTPGPFTNTNSRISGIRTDNLALPLVLRNNDASRSSSYAAFPQLHLINPSHVGDPECRGLPIQISMHHQFVHGIASDGLEPTLARLSL